MSRNKEFLIVIFFLVLLVPAALSARKRKPRNSRVERVMVSTPDSAGPVVKEKYRKRSPEEIFEALHAVLNQMTRDMDEFNFAKIHPHLKIVYALYNELRLLSVGGLDSLKNSFGNPGPDSAKTEATTISYPKNSNTDKPMRDTSLSVSDSSVIITIDQTNSPTISPLNIITFKPVMNTENRDPGRFMKEKLMGNQPTSFALSWNDTSFSKYLLKFEITQDSMGTEVWNIVFEKVDKMKSKTVKVHKYFDAGEFMISAQDLVWLCDQVKKSQTEILNYFHYNDNWKREEKKSMKADKH